jgi:CBS domain-containing protein
MKKTAERAPKTWADLSAGEIMKAPIVAVNESTLLADAARTLSDERISGVLVTDHRGAPVGVVSLIDIVAALAGLDRPEGELGGFYRQGRLMPVSLEDDLENPEEPPAEPATVREIMSPQILTVGEGETLDAVARALHEKQVHRLFVRGARGALVGVVSTMDLLRVMAGGAKE